MNRSGTNILAEVLLRLDRLVSHLRTTRQSQDVEEERECLLAEECSPPDPPPVHCLSPPSQLEARSSATSDLDDTTLTQRYAAMAWEPLLPLPFPYRLLGPEEVKLLGEHPIASGRFANLWVAMYKGREVGLKEYRCYVSFDIDQVIARFCNEVHVCDLLRHGGVDVVPLVGVYSTDTHPLVLVYEYADNLDLRQYLRNEPNVRRLDLLVTIAKCLGHMHRMDIAHGRLEITNILVDKGGMPHIAGLGNAAILPHSTTWIAEGTTGTGRLPGHSGPEFPTKADDVYNFGAIAWEVLTGRPLLFETTEVAATCSILNGARSLRHDSCEVSDIAWRITENCFHSMTSRRISIEEVVLLLEVEQSRISTSGV